ncbi:MAG: hypothetical protein R3281_06870 [Balneolaceae bacterium]|nr:hypothetical protein [Balneolaceae bacterium]
MNNIEASASKISHEELEFLKISDRSQLYVAQLKSYDGIIIEYSSRLATRQMIHKIRTHNDQTIYLIPLFIYKVYHDQTEPIPLADGILQSLSDLSGAAVRTRSIREKMPQESNVL